MNVRSESLFWFRSECELKGLVYFGGLVDHLKNRVKSSKGEKITNGELEERIFVNFFGRVCFKWKYANTLDNSKRICSMEINTKNLQVFWLVPSLYVERCSPRSIKYQFIGSWILDWESTGNVTPVQCHPPARNRALLRDYQPPSLIKALFLPYFLGKTWALGGFGAPLRFLLEQDQPNFAAGVLYWKTSAAWISHVLWRQKPFARADQWSNEKTLWLFLGFIGDEILPSYVGEYFINHEIRIPIKQPIQWKVHSGKLT